MADVKVTCSRCHATFDVPSETTRAECPACGAIGRWFSCANCSTLVDVWAKKDRQKWQYICPHCRRQHWIRVS